MKKDNKILIYTGIQKNLLNDVIKNGLLLKYCASNSEGFSRSYNPKTKKNEFPKNQSGKNVIYFSPYVEENFFSDSKYDYYIFIKIDPNKVYVTNQEEHLSHTKKEYCKTLTQYLESKDWKNGSIIPQIMIDYDIKPSLFVRIVERNNIDYDILPLYLKQIKNNSCCRIF